MRTFSLMMLPLSNCCYAQTAVVSRDAISDFFATSADFAQYRVDALLVDNAHALAGNTQTNKTLLGLNPEPVLVKIGQEPTTGTVLGVGYIVSGDRALPGDLTDSGHDFLAGPELYAAIHGSTLLTQAKALKIQ
jgi:hypothetical protein